MTYIVPVTGYDVWRITQDQRLAPSLFVQREPEAYPTDTGFLLRPTGSTYALALQHHRATHNTRICVFLVQMRDGVRRCGIYDQRPVTCRTYPVRMEHDQLVTRDDKLCPHGSWVGLDAEQAQWRALLQRQSWEWDLYAKVVEAWNTCVRAQSPESGFVLEQFLDYLLLAYDHLDHILSARVHESSTAELEPGLVALANAFVKHA